MFDDDSYGCLGTMIALVMIVWLVKIIGIFVLAILVLAAIMFGVRVYKNKKEEKATAVAEQQRIEKQQMEEKERESYDAFFKAQEGVEYADKLKESNALIISLNEEHDPTKREKILSFFNRYLPLMSETIEASKHTDESPNDAIDQFTKMVKTFVDNLYKADEVVDINTTVMEGLAIRDGLYDPYQNEIGE